MAVIRKGSRRRASCGTWAEGADILTNTYRLEGTKPGEGLRSGRLARGVDGSR